MSRLRIIGLTGGIGAGKSVVSRILRLKGYAVYDCDSESKRLMNESCHIRKSLCDRFGFECIQEDGKINRSHLSESVFGNKDDLNWLNALVHLEVREDFRGWSSSREEVCFVESAILATSHLDEMCDEIWLVEAPEDNRIERVLSRGGIKPEDLFKRIEVQRNEFEILDKEKVHIIRNYGDHSLLDQISSKLSKL